MIDPSLALVVLLVVGFFVHYRNTFHMLASHFVWQWQHRKDKEVKS